MHFLICMKVYECVEQMNKNASPLAAAGPLSCKATFRSVTRFAGTEDGWEKRLQNLQCCSSKYKLT